jgi:hypothetical protein
VNVVPCAHIWASLRNKGEEEGEKMVSQLLEEEKHYEL